MLQFEALLSLLKMQILEDDPSVQGFNVGMNCGEVARQTVLHAHIHLIPWWVVDVEDPRGVCRGGWGIDVEMLAVK
jgi:diadenosine tetraphosphate (Ap4A) HIT family hydrolase